MRKDAVKLRFDIYKGTRGSNTTAIVIRTYCSRLVKLINGAAGRKKYRREKERKREGEKRNVRVSFVIDARVTGRRVFPR